MAGASIVLRPAVPADLEALVALEQSCFSADRLSRRSLRRWLQAPHARLWVAAQNNVLCGYALLWHYRGTRVARLYSLAVAPAWRGQGLAGRLYQALEGEARMLGCACLRLEVAEPNTVAQALYRQLGFREFARIAGYYEDGSTALRMEKALGADHG